MGSFSSKVASKQYPMPVNLSNRKVKTNEQRKEDCESFTNIKKSDEDACEEITAPSQNLDEEDPCTTDWPNSNTSGPKRPANVHAASYLWLVSSPIIQDEADSLPKKSAVKYRSPEPSMLISTHTDRCQAGKDESVKCATRSRPQFYSYPTVSVRTKSPSFNGEKHSCTSSFSTPKAVRRNKSTSKSNASAVVLTRSVGFGVDKPYSCPFQRY